MSKTRVYMCVDAAGQWISIKSSVGTDPLEDAGLEVCDDQTEDYGGDFSDVLTIRELLNSESNFVPYD